MLPKENDRNEIERNCDKQEGRSSKQRKRRGSNGRKQRGQKSENTYSQRNDFSWYNKNPILTESVARIPFPYRPGMSIPLGEKGLAPVPGIMTITWFPTIGPASVPTDPVNVAAREIYGRVRAAYSGRLYADAPDFVVYLLSLSGIFSYIAALKRIYRITNMYTPFNQLLPDKLLTEMGFNNVQILTLKSGRVKLWQNINELISMTAKFRCPAVFDYMNRHYWLNDNVYADAASPAAQLYVLQQAAFFKFAMVNTPDGVPAGGCTVVSPPWLADSSSASIIDEMFSTGRSMIDALASSEDAYTINGYLERAYEGYPVFGVDPLVQDEPFEPLYSEPVLRQIENIGLSGMYPSIPNLSTSLWDRAISVSNIAQDPSTNSLLQTVSCKFTYKGPSTPPAFTAPTEWRTPLNSRMDVPSVEEVVEISRLAAVLDWENKETINDAQFSVPVICGSEVVVGMTVGFLGADGKTMQSLSLQTEYNDVTSLDKQALAILEAFDWHPRVTLISGQLFIPAYDIHNVASVTVDQLRELNKVCL